MRKNRKIGLVALVAIFLASALPAHAITIILQKEANQLTNVGRLSGTMSYNDADVNWENKTFAKFKVSGDPNKFVTILIDGSPDSAPTILTTGPGSKQMILTLACRAKLLTYPTSRTDGTACNGSNKIGSDNKLWISIFAAEASFLSGAGSGSYTGTIPISVNYVP